MQSGDTVRVHQRIREGNKQRVQVFEGVVIRTHRLNSVSATLTVRRIASGIGVEKTYLIHSPSLDRIEIIRRAKVRRNFLSYLRERRGKSARLKEVSFDREAANAGMVNAVAAGDAPESGLADDTVTDDATAEVTHLPAHDPDLELDAGESTDELKEADISTEDLAKEENKAAAADDASSSDGGTDGGDESEIEREEAEQKIDKPDSNN